MTFRQHLGASGLLSMGFKEKKNGLFILTQKVKRDNGFRSAMVDEIVAEITLDVDGYLVKSSGLEVDGEGCLLLYRRF